MNTDISRLPRTIIRIGRQTLAFALPAGDGGQKANGMVHYEPYTVKSGMSIAANLRNAFRDSVILSQPNSRVQVLIDSPVLLIPIEEFDDDDIEPLYRHTFPDQSSEVVLHQIIPDLNCVAVFSMNKDTRTVVSDHYEDVRIMPVMMPVWQHLHQRSYSGQARKLYAYFHDRQLSVFSYAKNRFRFVNTFSAVEVTDSAYFILYVWQQLGMNHRKDELYYVGEFPEMDSLRTELKKYVQNVFPINPSAEFNRAPVTKVPQVTYDVICHCQLTVNN